MLTELRALFVAAIALALSGCGTLYVAQAARGQWQVLRHREPIDSVIVDPSTSDELREKLLQVRRIREFAITELSLPDSSSYRTYADIGRRYVVWNVVAAPEFSVEPQRWCFPIAGCVAYRGYFSEKAARKFADSLHQQGFDVTVGGVAAYSTLGKLADPVLNTMMGYGDLELAAIIFHELAHQEVYVAGDSAFNEGFAVAVEEAGVARWLAARGRDRELDRYTARRRRQAEFVRLFARTRAELASLYRMPLAPDEMRARKREIFGKLDMHMQELDQRYRLASPAYAAWRAEGLNNAHLASISTYYDCAPGFERLLQDSGGDLQRFFGTVRSLAKLPAHERKAQACSPAPAVVDSAAPSPSAPDPLRR